jgi:DNA-binding NtrC family response regulator
VRIPPLRERVEDIPALADHFLEGFAREFGGPAQTFAPASVQAMRAFAWPGNVRELRNAVERAALLATGDAIEPHDLPAEITGTTPAWSSAVATSGVPALPAEGCALDALEAAWVAEALRRAGGNRSQAARLLGLNRDQIRYRIEKFGLEGRER